MIATTTDPLGSGIPEPVREIQTRTNKITLQDTGPPRPGSQVHALANTAPPGSIPPPTSWPELLDLAGRATASGVRQWMQESKAEAGGARPPPPARGWTLSVIALVLSVVAVVGVVAGVLAHQLSSSAYEAKQAEANAAFREALAVQSAAISAQRDAFYLLIDVLCVNDPRICDVERKLQRDTVRP